MLGQYKINTISESFHTQYYISNLWSPLTPRETNTQSSSDQASISHGESANYKWNYRFFSISISCVFIAVNHMQLNRN